MKGKGPDAMFDVRVDVSCIHCRIDDYLLKFSVWKVDFDRFFR